MITYEWHTDRMQMKYEYVRVTYGWHTSKRMTYKCVQMTYEWRTSTSKWHTRIHEEWNANAMKIIKLYKTFGVFKSKFSTLFVAKTLLKAVTNDFWLLGCSNSHSFLLEYSSVQKQGLVPKQFYRRPEWYILARLSTIFLFYLVHGAKTYLHCFLYENLSSFYI